LAITSEQFHEIGKNKIQKYDEWVASDPEKLSIKKLKEAVDYWRNEMKEDFHRYEAITQNDNLTHIPGVSNILVSSILYGLVERYYIKKLEDELTKLGLAKKRKPLKHKSKVV